MDKLSTKGKKTNIGAFVVLQIALFILSFGAVCSKIAGRQEFLSLPFCLFYGLLLIILFVYAIIWQQVLKKISLTVAYACKGIGIVYSIIWGVVFFQEIITWKMIVGALLVLAGVYVFIFGDLKGKKHD